MWELSNGFRVCSATVSGSDDFCLRHSFRVLTDASFNGGDAKYCFSVWLILVLEHNVTLPADGVLAALNRVHVSLKS